MSILKKSIFMGGVLFFMSSLISKTFSTDNDIDRQSPQRTAVQHVPSACERLQEIGKIWGKNLIQTVDILGLGQKCYTPLPSRSRDSRPWVIYFEDRAGYALSPLNWLWYLSKETLPQEDGNTMMIRGFVKKYNIEVRKMILPNDRQQ